MDARAQGVEEEEDLELLDEVPRPVDEALDALVCDVQDAYFEGRYRAVVELAAVIHAQAPAEEDTYDVLLAALVALGDYHGVREAASRWVSVCGESLKQLVLLAEAAYMLDDAETLDDVVYKLAHLFQASEFDPVFLPGALLGVALALDAGLAFPEGAVESAALLNAEPNEPMAYWLRLQLSDGPETPPAPVYDQLHNAQAADLVRCLQALHEPTRADELLRASEPVDATGVATRLLLCPGAPTRDFARSRVHPLVRKRLVAAEAKK